MSEWSDFSSWPWEFCICFDALDCDQWQCISLNSESLAPVRQEDSEFKNFLNLEKGAKEGRTGQENLIREGGVPNGPYRKYTNRSQHVPPVNKHSGIPHSIISIEQNDLSRQLRRMTRSSFPPHLDVVLLDNIRSNRVRTVQSFCFHLDRLLTRSFHLNHIGIIMQLDGRSERLGSLMAMSQ